MALSHLESWSNLNWSVSVPVSRMKGCETSGEARVPWDAIPLERGEVAMARRERVASTPFGQFMASTAGRVTRGIIGAGLIVAGLLVGGIGGWVLGAFGVLLVAAGLFDFCVITGLIDNIWSGREVRARGSRRAPRIA